MKRTTFIVLLFSLLAIVQAASAQTGGGYDLTWSTLDGGGGQELNGGNFALSGTLGQHDIGQLSGGKFTLVGGFWQANGAVPTAISLDAASSNVVQYASPLILLGLLSFMLALLSLRMLLRVDSAENQEVSHAA